jgi:hypothetical protein
MMGHGEDGLCHPITGCPGCAQQRRWREKALAEAIKPFVDWYFRESPIQKLLMERDE